MKYDSQVHHRHSLRLKSHDYRQAGTYFITLCTHQKQCWFGKIANAEMRLNALGKIALHCWQVVPHHCERAKLDAFVIMPNHFHGILMITQDAPFNFSEARQFGKSSPGSLGTIVRSYKAAVTRQINALCESKTYPIWQRNYYEHIIRDESALNSIRQYILENPQRWENDPERHERECELWLNLPF